MNETLVRQPVQLHKLSDNLILPPIFNAAGEMVLSGASLVLGTRSRPITLEDQLRMNASQNLAADAEDALHSVKVEKSITVGAYTPILVLFQDAI